MPCTTSVPRDGSIAGTAAGDDAAGDDTAGDAAAGADFVAQTNGRVTFLAGQTRVEVTVQVVADALDGDAVHAAVGQAAPGGTVHALTPLPADGPPTAPPPTPTHRRSLESAEQELAGVRERLRALIEERLPALERQLDEAGAPWTPGRPLPGVR